MTNDKRTQIVADCYSRVGSNYYDLFINNWFANGAPDYFETEWLLIPLLGNKIDLYAFEYQTDKILIYKGRVKTIPTTIIIESPKPINHCHYHIWYKR